MDENNILRNLPIEVLELIMKHLSLKDYLELRATCCSCRKMISNAIENKHCCHLPEMPILLFRSKNRSFFSGLSTKCVNQLGTPLRGTSICLGSVEGWLIMEDYSEKGFAKIFFLNPVTNIRIMIPSKLSLPSTADGISDVRKMVASTNPNCDDSDCYIVGLLNDFCHIAIYNFFDNSWTIVKSETYFTDMEIMGTKLYVCDSSSRSILVYDLKDFINGPPKAEVLAKLPETRRPQSSIISDHCRRCLAKDEALRELYFIQIFYYAKPSDVAERFNITLSYSEPPEITCFKVFKFDTNKNPNEWQNVQLEDRMAFLSGFKNMIISRDILNCNNELIRGNSICFALRFICPTNPWQGLKLGMFCLTDSSIKYFPVETSNHGDVATGDVPYPLWFVPSLC